MGKFAEGDRVVNANGDYATVLSSTEVLSVGWDQFHIAGTWPADAFELVSTPEAGPFAPGQYVRIVSDDELNGEVGLIFDEDGEDYFVSLFDDNETECWFVADELIAWAPKVGDRVIEADVDDEVGVVVGIGDKPNGVVRVLWDSFPLAQNWFVHDLEPAEPESGDEITVGDVVTYENPFFVGAHSATVLDIEGNVIRVKFHAGPFTDGDYPKANFERAA